MDVDESDDKHTQPCAQCAKRIDDDKDAVECFGKCKLAIHKACLPGATVDEVTSLCKLRNAVFVCDACIATHDDDDIHCKKSIDEILVKVNDFASVVELAKNFEKRVRDIVRSELLISFPVPANKELTTSESRRILRSTTKKRKIETGVQSGSNGDETPKSNPSFADVMKAKPTGQPAQNNEDAVKSKKKPDPVVIIKPKEGLEPANTKLELKKRVNPKDMNVSRVIEGKDGAVFVVLKDDESSQKLKENVEKEMGGQFEVKMREAMKPTIKIVGISEEMTEDELKTTLIDQNDVFDDLKYFKLRKFYCNQKWQYAAIVELDAATFFKVMENGKLNVGWDRCKVYDGLDVLRCFKCCQYNHRIADCKAEVDTCPKCCGNHRGKDCDSAVEKCVNCEKYRVQRKLDIKTDHPSWSTECPVYQRLLNMRNKQVDYTV